MVGFKNNKKKHKIKQKLSVNQNNEHLYIKGILNEKYHAKHLLFKSRTTEDFHIVDSPNVSNEFAFDVNLFQHETLYNNSEQIFDLYLIVEVYKNNLSEKQLSKIKENSKILFDNKGLTYYEYTLRLGRFQHTESSKLDSFTIGEKKCALFRTLKGNISYTVNQKLEANTKLQINYLKSKSQAINFGGKIFTKNSRINNIKLIIMGRDTNVETKVPVSIKFLKKETEKKFGLNRYKYNTHTNLNKVFKDQRFSDDVYDFYFEIKYHDLEEKVRVRVGNPRFRARFYTKGTEAIRGKEVFAVSPYYTVKRFNLSFQADSFEHETYTYLRRLMRWAWLLRLFYKRKNIWVVGERPYKAQDTGYHFFKFMRVSHPEKETYYVIEKTSPELHNVQPYGNLLFYKSKKHIKYVLMATRIIGSHHPDYLYPLRTNDFIRKVKGKKVFLQHGVLGTKNTEHFYGKKSLSFTTDLFLVSSDYEKSIVINDFGYASKEVAVTGLPRFDSLLNMDVHQKRQILIIPTWREWLADEYNFLESEYFERYMALVSSKEMQSLAKEYNFKIVFCLHPNMQKYTHYFNDTPVKVISQGEVDVQDLLKESIMMITDYSSVAFDFSFLEKPIIYYQFDRKRFIGKRGSHLDLDNDLPGDIAYDLDTIITLTKEYAQSNFEMKRENHKRAAKFLKYKDTNSSERIYHLVSENVRSKPFIKRFLETELYRTLYKRFRKSKSYFPIMKLFYKTSKHILPIDKNLILFESGIGKQFADSPKYIYEEIVNRNLNYKKVWVSNKNIRFNDPNTIQIKRLDPMYYYYLSKAKIWVNNQNFPTYIMKRPQTTYLQTWHGTPLKKMLFDIENIMGRSDDYLERVSKATKTWDYLISPSPYATRSFKSAFRYEGEILETGYPRNDLFYLENRFNIAHQIKRRLHVPSDKKVILYAPTFRDNQAKQRNKFDFELNMDLYKLREYLGNEYIILLRMHVVVSNNIKLDETLSDFIMNVSNYSDAQELLLISDILITDYSSVMFDFANTKRPILFYTYDLEEYRDNIRGFYLNFEQEAPGPLLRNTDELIENIINIEDVKNSYKQKYNTFYNNYCLLEDGNASKRIVDKLFDK